MLDADGPTFGDSGQERVGDTALIERCRREIAEIEGQIRAGHPDVQGLCLALSDWSAEVRILQNGQRFRASTRRRKT